MVSRIQDHLPLVSKQTIILPNIFTNECLPFELVQLPKSFPTVFGSPLKFSVTNVTGGYFVNDARVIKGGILLRNGVMHVIDKVLSL